MKESSQDSKLCNCRQKSSYPLDGKCLTKCVVYKATVTETTSNNQETYKGLTENEFKTRFNLHKPSFKLEHKRTSTTLSDHVWKLKKENINFNNFTWQVVKRVKPFAPSNKVCGLCLQEKLSIPRSAPSLNKRGEICGHCVHRKKFLLSNLSMSTDEVSIADRNSESWQEQYRLSILKPLYLSIYIYLSISLSLYIIYIYIIIIPVSVQWKIQ